MFFDSAHKLKLVDLDLSVLAGQESVVHKSTHYSSPEIARSQLQGIKKLILETSSDMWSFGIILFEVMSGLKFYGPDEDPQRIRNLLSSNNELIDEAISLECIDELQARSLIRKLVRVNPRDRRTATKASEHALFQSAMTTTQKNGAIETFSRQLDLVMDLTQLSLNQLTSANLMTAIRMEYFQQCIDLHDSFHLREGKDVFVIADDFLPDNPVFMLRIGESYRLRVTLMHDRMTQVPIKRIVGVKVLVPRPDGKDAFAEQMAVDLVTVQQTADADKVEAVALLDPQAIQYERLLKISPSSGEPSEKYVPLELTITASMSEDGTQAFDLKHKIYCQIVHPDNKATIQRFVRKFKKQWERFPQWMRDSARAAVFLANVTMSFH